MDQRQNGVNAKHSFRLMLGDEKSGAICEIHFTAWARRFLRLNINLLKRCASNIVPLPIKSLHFGSGVVSYTHLQIPSLEYIMRVRARHTTLVSCQKGWYSVYALAVNLEIS